MKRLIIALALLMPFEAMALNYVIPDLAKRIMAEGRVLAHAGEDSVNAEHIIFEYQGDLFKCLIFRTNKYACYDMEAFRDN